MYKSGRLAELQRWPALQRSISRDGTIKGHGPPSHVTNGNGYHLNVWLILVQLVVWVSIIYVLEKVHLAMDNWISQSLTKHFICRVELYSYPVNMTMQFQSSLPCTYSTYMFLLMYSLRNTLKVKVLYIGSYIIMIEIIKYVYPIHNSICFKIYNLIQSARNFDIVKVIY